MISTFSLGSAGELFTPIQIRRVRDWMDAQRTRPGPVLKIAVLASSPSAQAGLLAAFDACGDFRRRTALPGEKRPGDLGTLGELALADGLRLRLVAVPPASDMAPLWGVAAHGALVHA